MTHINLTGPVFDLLRNAVAELDVRAFVIGGYVRDVILGRECKDIDVVVEGSGIELAKKVASKLGKGAHVRRVLHMRRVLRTARARQVPHT